MTTFYPGPSQIYPQVAEYLQDAFNSGILSANHRSPKCMALVEETVGLLHEKLNIPADYSIFFTSSATECWEIINQSFFSERVVHIYNGAFGKKWYDYSKKIAKNQCIPIEFEVNEELPNFKNEFDDIICFTQNETSNGTQISMDSLVKIGDENCLKAVDITSSLAGIELDYSLADIWFGSVQKCFGLPAGLGIMINSPKTMHVAEGLNELNHYNSFLNIAKNMKVFQTTHTPNVLGIYLLNRVLKQIPNISETSKRIKFQARNWYDFFETNADFTPICTNPKAQSSTVIVLKGDSQKIVELKKKTQEVDLILGNGYGEWKDSTFRIANFPAIDPAEIDKLKHCISNF
jgi:phosphoserine aminotransferase